MLHVVSTVTFLMLGGGALLTIFHSLDSSVAQIRMALIGTRAVRVAPPAPALVPALRPRLCPAPVATWRAPMPLRAAA